MKHYFDGILRGIYKRKVKSFSSRAHIRIYQIATLIIDNNKNK
jgi:hypothetical protein